MIGPACEERGADLYAAARDGELPPDLARHLDACEPCRAEFANLRRLAADLPLASAGLAPRAATREAILREIGGAPAAPPEPRRIRRGTVIPMWAPVAAALAGAAALIFVMSRPDAVVTHGGGAAPSTATVTVTRLWGDAALDGMTPGGVAGGSVLAASEVSSIRLGPPFDSEVVLGRGARLGVHPDRRALEVEAGIVYLAVAASATGPVLAPDGVRVGPGGARLSAERGDDGSLVVVLESGSARVESRGPEVRLEGPCRLALPKSGPPGEPIPAEAPDASAWFSYPELSLERRPSLTLGEEDLVLELRPSVDRPIRIAPWDRFDPLFTIRVHRADGSLLEIPVRAEMLRRPAPAADSEGAFLLRPENPYTIYLDPAALGLPGGKVRLEAVYAAGRPGGLWRGVRASNELEYRSK